MGKPHGADPELAGLRSTHVVADSWTRPLSQAARGRSDFMDDFGGVPVATGGDVHQVSRNSRI